MFPSFQFKRARFFIEDIMIVSCVDDAAIVEDLHQSISEDARELLWSKPPYDYTFPKEYADKLVEELAAEIVALKPFSQFSKETVRELLEDLVSNLWNLTSSDDETFKAALAKVSAECNSGPRIFYKGYTLLVERLAAI